MAGGNAGIGGSAARCRSRRRAQGRSVRYSRVDETARPGVPRAELDSGGTKPLDFVLEIQATAFVKRSTDDAMEKKRDQRDDSCACLSSSSGNAASPACNSRGRCACQGNTLNRAVGAGFTIGLLLNILILIALGSSLASWFDRDGEVKGVADTVVVAGSLLSLPVLLSVLAFVVMKWRALVAKNADAKPLA